MSDVYKVAVTGALGQIAYSLIFRIVSGEMLGPNKKIALSLVDVPGSTKSMEGLIMELQDGCFPLLDSVSFSDDPMKGFEGVDLAVLIGARPRGPGMERVELLRANGEIFVHQGRALDKVASKNVKVVVIGNPCNTNALICMHNAPSLDKNNFSCLMMLDQKRAHFQLAQKAGVPTEAVTNVTIWGNHSITQVPDSVHALINKKPLASVILDREWLDGEFMKTVQTRGAQVIKARGKSSAASAANAIVAHVQEMMQKTNESNWFSSGVYSKGNPYGIDENLIFSFPIVSNGEGDWSFVENLDIDSQLEKKIKESEEELIKERDMVKSWLK